MSTSTASIRLPLRSYPGMNPFVLDWLDGAGGATRFLPRGLAQGTARSGPRDVSDALAQAIVDSNRRWGLDVSDAVRQWRDGAVAFVAGQQVGIGGGPLYTLAKLASLVRMKRRVAADGGRAVAFFWLATEDHDYDEVASIAIPAKIARGADRSGGDLVTLRAARRSDERFAVGSLELPERLRRELDSVLGLEHPSWLRDGVTFGDSFAELIAATFGDEVVLVDAMLPELRRAGGPLLASVAARAAEVQKVLAARADELLQAGYREQVTARDGEYTLLFELVDGVRRPLDRDSAAAPESISTSALTRPLLQDAVIAPDVFVGGPAEVAYYAQVGALHGLFGIPQPRVALRGHALVAPFRLVRSAEKFALPLGGVFASPESLVEPQESAGVAEIEAVIDRARTDLLGAVDRVAELSLPAEHALAARIQRSVGHLEYHLEKLKERSVRSLLRRDRERFAVARSLVSTLYPDGQVQDRVVSWLALWSRYGQDLVERMIEEIEPDSSSFIIIDI